MDLSSASNEQLRQNLQARDRTARGADAQQKHELERTIEELRVHRVELEMQNRALREAQSELEYAIQRYADLYDHLPIGYVTLSPCGEIVEANLTAATWLGVERSELRGMFLSRFLNPFDAGRFAVHLETCARTATERIFETTMRVQSGAMIPVQFSSRPGPSARDGATQILVAMTNVAQLKQTQQLISEIQREQDALGDSISHDLRSPLITIGTYAKIILTEHTATLAPDVKHMMERVDRAAQRMEATLRQLLAYSVLVREDATPQRVELDEVVQGVLREFRTQTEASGATVEVQRPLPAVRGCPRLLAPALGNLLSNALKFTATGQLAHVTIAAESRGEFVILKVTDRGIGIEPQHHERIFGVFDRLHGYSTYPGTGVGLAIVRRAVERMHGRVWVESEKGKGSCFHIMLPHG